MNTETWRRNAGVAKSVTPTLGDPPVTEATGEGLWRVRLSACSPIGWATKAPLLSSPARSGQFRANRWHRSMQPAFPEVPRHHQAISDAILSGRSRRCGPLIHLIEQSVAPQHHDPLAATLRPTSKRRAAHCTWNLAKGPRGQLRNRARSPFERINTPRRHLA